MRTDSYLQLNLYLYAHNTNLPTGLFYLRLKQGFFGDPKTACSSTWAPYSHGFALRQQNIYAFFREFIYSAKE